MDCFGLHVVVFFIVPKVLGVPMPQILDQIVDVPVPHLIEETVEAAKLIPEERIQQRTLEETVSVPVPQIQEQIVAVVQALFERRAVAQQLLTGVFFCWREGDRVQANGICACSMHWTRTLVPGPGLCATAHFAVCWSCLPHLFPSRFTLKQQQTPLWWVRSRASCARHVRDPRAVSWSTQPRLWFADFHAYHNRVHAKTFTYSIRRAKQLVPDLFGPVAPDTFRRWHESGVRDAYRCSDRCCSHSCA